MVLGPFPQKTLARLFVDYAAFGKRHHMQFHIQGGTTQADAITAVRDVTSALLPMLHTTTQLDGARWADAGSNVSWPVTWALQAGTSTNVVPASEYPVYYDFVGRGLTGRRTRLMVFGGAVGRATDFRWTTADYSQVGAVLAALRAQVGIIRCVDGSEIRWKDYANTGLSSYWQRKYRS